MTLKVPPFKPIIVRAGEAIGWPQIQRFLDANREKQPDPETPGEEADVLLSAQRFKPISVHGFGRDGRALTMDETMRIVYADNGEPVMSQGCTVRLVFEPANSISAWYGAVMRGATTTPSPTTQETPVNAPTTKTTHIEPTVGRKLWLKGTPARIRDCGLIQRYDQPFDATIICVHPAVATTARYQMVKVQAFDHDGNLRTLLLPLRQDGDEEPPAGLWLEWMPYQTGQARKERTAEAAQDKEATERAATVDLGEMSAKELERALKEPVRFTADAAATPKVHHKPGTIVRLATGLGPTMTVDGDGSVMWFNDKEVLMRDTIPVACLTLVREPQPAVPPVANAAAVPPTFGFDLALQLLREGKKVRRASWESTGRLFLDLRNHSEFIYYDDFSPRRLWAINPASILANDWTLAE